MNEPNKRTPLTSRETSDKQVRHKKSSPDSSIRGGRQKSLIISGPAEVIDDFQVAAERGQHPSGWDLIHWNSNSIKYDELA